MEAMGQAADAELSRGELLQASIELTRHALGYVKSMALACAAQLGVADAIQRGGGEASLDSLLAALSLSPRKLPHLGRVMRVLTSSGVFAVADDGGGYRLTPVSTLLLSDAAGGGGVKSLLQMVKLELSPCCVAPATNLAEWFTREEEETPFTMTFGTDHWGFCGRDPGYMELFNGAMASDSRFVMDAVIHEMGDVFDGVASMVDVAGGTGAAAKAVAAAFPRIKCSVLDLPQVIDGIPADGGLVEFIAGDMMDFIPQADALLLKFVLHDWSDGDCVTILKRCKDACKEPGGKVIIIDAVVGSTSQEICHETQHLFDLLMSTMTPGKEREEKEWCKLFQEAGFGNYKIRSMLGFRSLIEVFP